MLEPNQLTLPRTVAVEFEGMISSPMELSSKNSIERRRYKITVYSTMRGDLNDLIELLYAGLHGSGDMLSYPGGFNQPLQDVQVMYESQNVKYSPRPFTVGQKTVYSASLFVDAVSTRSG